MPENTPYQMASIALCPSTLHRSLLGLVRVAAGRPHDRSLVADLKASDPEELAPLSVYTYVHVVAATAFARAPDLGASVPDDLVIFFQEMQSANQRRNEAILAQLIEIGATLSDAGISAVALKGAAELLAPVLPEPAFRFLSDLDILVPAAEVERASAVLAETGARADEVDEAVEQQHHHIAPLRRDDWPVMVELHRGLGTADGRGIVPAERVIEARIASDYVGLDTPSPAHRLAHSVFHAQLHRPRFREKQLSLRDVLEFDAMLQRFDDTEISAARALFSRIDGAEAWDALEASRVMILGDRTELDALPPAARAWAEKALVDFGRPGRTRVAGLSRLAGRYLKEMLFNRERRRHYLGEVFRPGRLRRFLAHHRDRIRRTR